MAGTRKKHSASFKAQVALAALKEQESLSELSVRFGVHPQMILAWKRQFLSRGSELFETKLSSTESSDKEKELYEKIGRLEMEVDFCRRASEKLGILKPSKR